MRVQGFVQLDLAIAAALGAATSVTAKGTGALNNLTQLRYDSVASDLRYLLIGGEKVYAWKK